MYLTRFIEETRRDFENSLKFTTISSSLTNQILSEGALVEEMDDPVPELARKRPRHVSFDSPAPSSSMSSKFSTAKKPTARDVFGSDNEDEVDEQTNRSGKKPVLLTSYLTRRLANGVARQMFYSKPGSHYIELKV